MPRRALAWVVPGVTIAAMAVALVACEKPSAPDTDVLRIGLESEAQNLDPRYAVDAYSDRINKLLYRGLFRVDRDGSVQRDLATEYSYFGQQSGPTFFDVAITNTAVFHNGSRLTVDDVIYTYRSVMESDTSPKAGALEVISSVQAVTNANGQTTIRFTLKEPFAPLLTSLTMGIVPMGSARDLAQIPMGAGPFRMASNRGGSMVLQRHPKPIPGRFNTVEFRVIKNDAARSIALENGEIDILQNALPPQDIGRMAASENLAVDRHSGANISYMGFNLEDKVLAKPQVREALSLAIDRAMLIQTLLDGTAVATGSILPRTNWAYNPALLPDPYDPARADALLTEAGYPRKKDGSPRLRLEYKTSTNKLRVRLAEAITAEWSKLGVETSIVSLEFGTFFEHIRKGNFQLYTLTWTGLTEPDIMFNAFHSSAIPPIGANRNRLRDGQLDKMLEDARSATDGNQRRTLYQDAQKRVAELRPYAILWEHENIIARSEKVSVFAPYPDGSYLFVDALKVRD